MPLGIPLAREMAGGERHLYRIEPAAGPLLVSVEQQGINLVLDLSPSSGGEGGGLGPSNQDAQREGWETLLLPSRLTGSGAWLLEVVGRETGVPPGHYEIRVEELPQSTPEERLRVAAEEMLTEIGRLRARGDGESTRRIVALAGQARPGFDGVGSARDAGRILFLEGDARRALGDCRGAAPIYEQAIARFAAAAAEAAASQAETALGVCRLALGDPEGALARFNRALDIQVRRGDRYGEATTRANLCLARHRRGEWQESIPCYQQALGILREVRAPDGEAIARANLGGVYDLLGEPAKARAAYEATLPLLRALGERQGEISVLNNLGVLLTGIGETGEALQVYDQALAAAVSAGDLAWVAKVRQNRGVVYLATGEILRANAEISLALEQRRASGDRQGEISALVLLGATRERLGDRKAALDLLNRAAALAREAKLPGLEASARQILARSNLASGQAAAALSEAEAAIALFRAQGDRRGLAAALTRRGEALRSSARPEAALAPLGEALALRRGIDDRAGEAETLTALAAAERQLGRKVDAGAHVEEALHLVEKLRAAVVAPELRASFLAAKRQTFDLALDLAMDGALGDPRAAEAGFALAERARSRTLLDLLDAARVDPRGPIDPALRLRAAEVGQRLAAKARRRTEILAGSKTAAPPEAFAREIEDLLAEDDRVTAEIRARKPRAEALTRPQPLGAVETRELLAPDEMLIEYALGDEKSYLWAVTRDGVTSYFLPPRAEIERLARQVYEELRTADVGDARTAETERAARRALVQIVLGPLAARLDGHRLLVVADGALGYVPFAALPLPGDLSDLPLIERHEVLSLPSASVLAALREVSEPQRASRRAILVGDPVFSSFDPRVAPKVGAPHPSTDPIKGERGTPWERLPYSRREIEEIAAIPRLAAAGEGVVTRLGFDANRDAVLGGALSDAAILHFATHGVIDTETPRLSGLVLSLVDPQGSPREGFLGLADLYGLDLRADLVVLSGCETALGREMRGEGLIGLTHGFLQAGARRVMASLWRVQDRPTAELMVLFYRGLLEEGLAPSAALRQAQRAIRRERRWQDPAYWAGFILEGDGAAGESAVPEARTGTPSGADPYSAFPVSTSFFSRSTCSAITLSTNGATLSRPWDESPLSR